MRHQCSSKNPKAIKVLDAVHEGVPRSNIVNLAPNTTGIVVTKTGDKGLRLCLCLVCFHLSRAFCIGIWTTLPKSECC